MGERGEMVVLSHHKTFPTPLNIYFYSFPDLEILLFSFEHPKPSLPIVFPPHSIKIPSCFQIQQTICVHLLS